jgi:hypothetical protein
VSPLETNFHSKCLSAFKSYIIFESHLPFDNFISHAKQHDVLSKITLVFLLASFFISTLYAQTALTLSGRILGEEAKPLPKVTVALLNPNSR